jgi:acetyl-CoA C-acetyltransferase
MTEPAAPAGAGIPPSSAAPGIVPSARLWEAPGTVRAAPRPDPGGDGRMSDAATREDHAGLGSAWEDAWLLDGVRTPFADLSGAFALVSPIDLGIKAAREALARAEVAPDEVGTVIAGNLAPASFDAFMLPRHIGLYAGVPIEVPAIGVQRLCGTGIEAIIQAADTITYKGVEVALCVGAESMSRNPIAAFTHRNGFGLGQVEFKDLLWEALPTRRPA